MSRRRPAFTLIELLVVVIIIGLLMAIAVPIYLNQRASAQDRAAEAQLRSAANAQASYYAQNNTFTNNETALGPFGYPTSGAPDVSVTDPTDTTGNQTFCVTATSQTGNVYYSSNTNTTPHTGSCAGGSG